MPLLPYVFKGFIFDEPAMGKPHPPRPWGSRLDVAKRFVPPLNDPAAPPPPGITLTLSTTDATVREAAACLARGGPTAALDGRLPQDLLVTATAEGEDGWTYMLGYDAGASTGFARAAVAGPASAAAATWFQAGGHVRFEAAADLVGGARAGAPPGGETAWAPSLLDDASSPSSSSPIVASSASWALTGWGTLTLRDGASQANSTACNLAERESGFIVAPFTARTSTAAAALRLERRAGVGCTVGPHAALGGATPSTGPGSRGGGGWAAEGAYDFQTCRSYASLEVPVRLPLLRRRLGTLAARWAAQDGVGLLEFSVGAPPLDGTCPPGAAAAAAGRAAGARPAPPGRGGWLGGLGRVKAFIKADAGPGKAWMGTPAFGLIIDRAVEL